MVNPFATTGANLPRLWPRRCKQQATKSCVDDEKSCASKDHTFGIGIGCYVEGTGVGSFEGAKVRIDASGEIVIGAPGTTGHGQGHETIFAQIAAHILGCEAGRCEPCGRRYRIDSVRLRHVWQPQHRQCRLGDLRSIGALEKKRC